MNVPIPNIRIIDNVNTPRTTIVTTCSMCGAEVSRSVFDLTRITESAPGTADGLADGSAWLEHVRIFHQKPGNA